MAVDFTVSAQNALTSPTSKEPNTQYCLSSGPYEETIATYPDPIPPGGFPVLFDSKNIPTSTERPFFSLRLLGVLVFVLFGLIIVLALILLKKRGHSGYSKFRQMEVEGEDSDADLDL